MAALRVPSGAEMAGTPPALTEVWAAPARSSLPRTPWSDGSTTGSVSRSLPGRLHLVSRGRRRCSCKVASQVRDLTAPLTDVEGLRFAVVVGRFNQLVTKPLLDGALEEFRRHGVKEGGVSVVWVPGSFEIPIVAQTLANSGNFDAVLCIGAVIKGETSHYDAVVSSAASGVMSAGLKSGVPCVFGIVTCETMEQALQRAGGKAGNKGAETALVAIEMASLFQHHLNKLTKK